MLKSLIIFLLSVLVFSVPMFAQDPPKKASSSSQKSRDLEKVYISAKKYVDKEADLNKLMEELSAIYPSDFSHIGDINPFSDHDDVKEKVIPNEMSKELLKFAYYLLINNDENIVYVLDTKSLVNEKHFLQLIGYIKELTNISDDKEIFKFILKHYSDAVKNGKVWVIAETWIQLLEHHYFKNIRAIDTDLVKPKGVDFINYGYEEKVLTDLYIKERDLWPSALGYVVGPEKIDKVIDILNSPIYDHLSYVKDEFNRIRKEQKEYLLELKKNSKDIKEEWTYLERQVKREEILLAGKQHPNLYDPEFLEEVRLDYVMDVLEHNEGIEINQIMYIYDLDELFKLVDDKTTTSIAMQYGLKYRKQPVNELRVTDIEIVKMKNESAWASKDMLILYGRVNSGRKRPLSWLFYTIYPPSTLEVDLVYTLPELRGQHLGEALFKYFLEKHKEVKIIEAILGMENHSEFYRYLVQEMGDQTASNLDAIKDQETHEILINTQTDLGDPVVDVVIEGIKTTPLGKNNSKIGFELAQILFFPRGEHVEVRWTKKDVKIKDIADMELPQDKRPLNESEFFKVLSSYTGSDSNNISEHLDLIMKTLVSRDCVFIEKDETLLFGSAGKKGVYDYLYTLVKQSNVSNAEDIKFFLMLTGAISVNTIKLRKSDSDIVLNSYIEFGLLSTEFNTNNIINNGLQKRPYMNNPQTIKLFSNGFELMKSYNKSCSINIR